MKSKYAFLLLSLTFALSMIACSDSGTKPAATAQPGVEDAVKTAVDAYVYGYPFVTMDMTRKQFTNVAAPDAAHAPMGQILSSGRIQPSITTPSPLRTPTRFTRQLGSTFRRSLGFSVFPTWETGTTFSHAGRMDGRVPGSRQAHHRR